MTQEILSVVENLGHITKIIIRGEKMALNKIYNELKPINHSKLIEYGTKEQSVFFDELGSCKIVLSVPGMSIVYETLMLKKPLLFLLPLNYSQMRQMQLYNKIFLKPSAVHWDDLNNYSSIKEKTQEEKAISKITLMSERFSRDIQARKEFNEIMRLYLQKDKVKPLSINKSHDRSYTTDLNGAEQIVNSFSL